MKVASLSLLTLGLALFAASCGDKDAATTTTGGKDSIQVSTANGTRVDTVHIDTASKGAMNTTGTPAAGTAPASAATTTTSTATGTAQPAGTAPSATTAVKSSGSTTADGHMEDGTVKTKTVTTTKADGTTEVKKKVKTSH